MSVAEVAVGSLSWTDAPRERTDTKTDLSVRRWLEERRCERLSRRGSDGFDSVPNCMRRDVVVGTGTFSQGHWSTAVAEPSGPIGTNMARRMMLVRGHSMRGQL